MKIFHLSDLHIGMNLMNYDLIEDQRYVFDQIIAYAKKEKPDVILIAGKGHEDYQEIKGVKHHFDDREEVRKIFS